MTSVGCGLKTELPTEFSAASRNSKAFVHAVMEGMTVRTEDGRGPADCRVAIVFPIIVTP